MRNEEVRAAAIAGIKWLLSLQNRDGGIPTFCRGWGALPFDRSSADITAHAMRAWLAWFDDVDPGMQKRLMAAMNRAVSFLVGAQRHDGSWLPLWFGNQTMPDDENPTYGTARVLEALVPIIKFAAGRSLSVREQRNFRQAHEAESRGALWLICSQRMDGGWGGGRNGPVSVEETALAVQGLAGLAARSHPAVANRERVMLAANNGARWLMARVESGEWTQPSPIGFYFAKLWYFERLYPLIFTVGALRQVAAFANAKAP